MLQFGLQLTTYLVYQYLKCHVSVWLQFISGDLGLKLENVQIDMFGSAKVIISKDGTIIHDGGGKGVTRKAMGELGPGLMQRTLLQTTIRGARGRCKIYTST